MELAVGLVMSPALLPSIGGALAIILLCFFEFLAWLSLATTIFSRGHSSLIDDSVKVTTWSK